MVPVKTRWRHDGEGRLLDCFGREVSIRRAIDQFDAWARQAQVEADRGNLSVAKLYMRDAMALSLPASLAFNWRKQNGWTNPLEERA